MPTRRVRSWFAQSATRRIRAPWLRSSDRGWSSAMSRRGRKRARAAAAGEIGAPTRSAAPVTPASATKPPSRSELRNQAARQTLEPLEPGERPGAVTAAALVAAVLLVMNLAAAVVGYDAPGGGSNTAPLIVYTILLGTMAWGLWRARYWAVLGMQALLALTMLISGLAAPLAANLISAVLAGAIFLGAGALFWFLIKAMARIQMPDRR